MCYNIRHMLHKKIIQLHIVSFVFCALFLAGSYSLFANSEAQLRAELERAEREVKEQEAVVQQKKAQTTQIQTQVNQLTTKVNQVQRNIDSKNSVIKELGSDISIKDQTVSQLNNKLDRSSDVLAAIIRAKNKADEISLVEIIFTHENMSDFFVTVDSVSTIQTSIYDLLGQIRELRGLTEEEKIKLEEKRVREQEVKAQIELEKKQVEVKRTQEQSNLATAKAVEQTEAQKLAEKQAKAAAIRSELFRLRDTGSLTFEQAQAFAESAGRATGVRPAFILGILRQETNIGQFLGSCVITNLDSATMKHVTTGALYTDGIHPTRDLPPLKDILKRLGRDPLTTRVSCPQSFGYGGAMGPSQFIPSTWKMYENRIAQALGVPVADPWVAQHAIMGTALLLRDNGAVAGDTQSERNAACKYYSGQSCAATNPAIASYGNSVMSHTATFQSNIDFLRSI
jgi:membrane-bound lytic murein transglycosylase B